MLGSSSQPETTTALERPPGLDPGCDRWLTVQEVADRLHVSRDTVERWIHTSVLRAANVSVSQNNGRYRPLWRVPNEALEEFLSGRFNKPPTTMKRRRRRRIAVGSIIEFIR